MRIRALLFTVALVACGGGDDAAVLDGPAGLDAPVDGAVDSPPLDAAEPDAIADGPVDAVLDAVPDAMHFDAPPGGAFALRTEDGPVAAVNALNFYDTAVGASPTAIGILLNNSFTDSGIVGLSIAGPDAGLFTLGANTCNGQNVPGFPDNDRTCQLAVTFHPTAPGDFHALLVVTSPNLGDASYSINARALPPPSTSVKFFQPALDAGVVLVQATQTVSFELQNLGAATVALGAPQLDPVGAPFTLGATTCGASLAGGTSCNITVTARPDALGPRTVALHVPTTEADGVHRVDGTVHVSGGYRVTVTKTGPGNGTITSSVPAITCGNQCSGLFDGAVTLTAAPGGASAFAGWTDCPMPAGLTCVIAASTLSVSPSARFELTGASEVDVAVSGTASVQVSIAQGANSIGCNGTCTLAVTPGNSVTITIATPSSIETITGACTTANCTFAPQPGVNTINVTVAPNPHEVFTRLGTTGPTTVYTFDSANNLIVSTPTGIAKLSPTGLTLWTAPFVPDCITHGLAGDIVFTMQMELVKLAPDGTVMWRAPLPEQASGAKCVAVAPDGSIAVRGSMVTRWTAAGVRGISFTPAAGVTGIGFDAASHVVLGVGGGPTDDLSHFIVGQPYAADGTPLPVTGNIIGASGGAILTSDAAGNLTGCASAGKSNYVGLNMVYRGVINGVQCVIDSAGVNRTVVSLHEFMFLVFGPVSFTSPSSTTIWSVAVSASGRVAVGGTYQGSGIVQVYDPAAP